MIDALLKIILHKWVCKNYPKRTRVEIIKTIFVKKGKIREWRSYDEDHNRIKLTKYFAKWQKPLKDYQTKKLK